MLAQSESRRYIVIISDARLLLTWTCLNGRARHRNQTETTLPSISTSTLSSPSSHIVWSPPYVTRLGSLAGGGAFFGAGPRPLTADFVRHFMRQPLRYRR